MFGNQQPYLAYFLKPKFTKYTPEKMSSVAAAFIIVKPSPRNTMAMAAAKKGCKQIQAPAVDGLNTCNA